MIGNDVDRTGWPSGPWDAEPDRVEWRVGAFTGLLLRHPRCGHWCGYLGVPPGHPWHGRWPAEADAGCHGGVTYAAECSGRVCHVPAAGEPEHLWWIGFDAAHAGDRAPREVPVVTFDGSVHHLGGGSVYRTAAYMAAEVERLAAQAT